MLSEWKEIKGSFDIFEKKTIMKHQLSDLGKIISEGVKKDWKSINKKTYIDKCTSEINKLNKTRLIIAKELTTINNTIISIENMKLVELNYNSESLDKFMNIQNNHMKNQNNEVTTSMENIKNACLVIEQTNNTNAKDKKINDRLEFTQNLRLFRTFVEVKILNALIKSIAKGLNTLVVMFCLLEKVMNIKGCDHRLPWLFKINVSNILPDVTLDPGPKDVIDQMKFLVNQVYDVSKFLPRFKDEAPDKNIQEGALGKSVFELFKEEDIKESSDFDQYE